MTDITPKPKHPPREVRCAYVKVTDKDNIFRFKSNEYRCSICGEWTANIQLYRYGVCPKRDRRKRLDDRRQGYNYEQD